MKHLKWTETLLMLAVSATLGMADEPTLKVGDPAPKLKVSKWVQGEPVKDFEKGKAYIVEFWATWCGPCRVSIPHLNEIYTKYKDKGLIVIGQDCWEKDDSLVAPFVKKMDDKMTYRVAMDDKDSDPKGVMAKTWMAAAGRNGIPSAFLVDTKGTIAWIGHPMQLKESVIEDVLAGTYDVKKAAQIYDDEQRAELKSTGLVGEFSRAMQKSDWKTALAKLDELEAATPEAQRETLVLSRFKVLLGSQDYTAAYKLAKEYSAAHSENAAFQNEMAWQMLTDPSIKERNLELAETIAVRANDATKGKDAGILDTLARAQFMRDRKADAIATQEKAVALASADDKSALEKTLDSYKRGELSKSN